jgi:hypothetical protein
MDLHFRGLIAKGVHICQIIRSASLFFNMLLDNLMSKITEINRQALGIVRIRVHAVIQGCTQ